MSIVVPTYREARNVPQLIERIERVARDADLSVELLIVDDDSRDGTEAIVASMGRPWVRLLVRAEAVRLLQAAEQDPPGANCLTGTLLVKTFRGPATLLEADVQGTVLRAEVVSEAADSLDTGKPLRLAILPEACRIIEVLPREAERH